MIKMVNIDLDGTLLNSSGRITEETKKVFAKAKENGVEVVLTSGRPPKSTTTLAKESGASKYIISANGALVYDTDKGEKIFSGLLSKEKALEIIDLCEENSIYYNIYTENEIITRELAYNCLFYHKENIFKPQDKRTNINIVYDIRDYIENSNIQDFLKITICDNSKVVFNNIITKLRKIEGIDVLDTAYMSRKVIKDGTDEIEIAYFYTEISSSGINKWTGIKKLSEKLNIIDSEIMTIGDNVNDMEMIKNAGIGVAMDNSGDEIKKVSKYVTKNNNDDGVAYAIKKFILKEEM